MPEGHPAHLRSDVQECSLAILTTKQVLNLAQASQDPQNMELLAALLVSESCRHRASTPILAEQDFVVCY